MEAKRDRGPEPRALTTVWLGGGLAAWAAFVLCAGILLLLGQIQQAKYEFLDRADTVVRATEGVLRANDDALHALASFVEAADAPRAAALQDFTERLLARTPQIDRVSLIQQQIGDAIFGPSTVWHYTRASDEGRLQHVSSGEPGALQDAVALSARWQRAAASPLIDRAGGHLAYYLVRPLRVATADGTGLSLAVEISVDALLPAAEQLPAGLMVTLSDLGGNAALQRAADDLNVTDAGSLLPMLRTERLIGGESQPFVLTVHRPLGWGVVQPHAAVAFGFAALLALWMVVCYVNSRSRREQNRRAAERRLYRLANYDTLTGLPNRNLFHDRLQQALARAQRYNRGVALCFVDLDGFKAVNDTAGHSAGDQLLQMVSARLQASVRANDTVARLAGDEFVVVLEDVRGRADAERVLGQLHDSFIEPFAIGEYQFMLTASIGLAVYPEDGLEPAELLHRADAQMYAIKYPEWVAEAAPSWMPKSREVH